MKAVIFVLSLLQYFHVVGQSELGLTVNYNRLDFFHGIEYTYSQKRFSFSAGFEVGVNRTYLQRQFFPRLKAGIGYSVIAKEKFKLQPMLQYTYAVLQFNRLPKTFAHYHETLTGLRWRYGKKWQIGQTLLIGAIWERSYNTLFKKSTTASALGYTAQIDFIYAF